MLGSARYKTYLDAASGDKERAAELYEWSARVSSAWHYHISYIEVAVRNSIDVQLRKWNATQPKGSGVLFSADWTAEGEAAQPVYAILKDSLGKARIAARKEARFRPDGHPRRGITPNHDDVIAQLMFGSWSRLVMAPGSASQNNQKLLWEECLSKAFAYAEQSDRGRKQVGRQLESVRRLRNRVAHHDNLLEVDISARLNGSLKLLSFINPDFPTLAMGSNTLRPLAKADPRKSW